MLSKADTACIVSQLESVLKMHTHMWILSKNDFINIVDRLALNTIIRESLAYLVKDKGFCYGLNGHNICRHGRLHFMYNTV